MSGLKLIAFIFSLVIGLLALLILVYKFKDNENINLILLGGSVGILIYVILQIATIIIPML